MMRLLRILERALRSIPLWFKYKEEFNSNIAFWMCYVYVFPSKKNERYFEAVKRYFNDEFKELVNQYVKYEQKKNDTKHQEKITVWTCWLSGYEAMPEIVKLCFRSMEENIPKNKAELKLITYDNYTDYINLPDYICKKHDDGIISAAHFSDIIRFCLLSEYGGMWLDSTVYVSGKIPDNYINCDYYTQKVRDINKFPKEPSRAQWCGFIWAGCKGNVLFEFVRDGLLYYWKQHSETIDYIFFDYIILVAYNNISSIREMMDKQEPNNENVWGLWRIINNDYCSADLQDIFEENIFHKLTYKGKLWKKNREDVITTYGYILETKK